MGNDVKKYILIMPLIVLFFVAVIPCSYSADQPVALLISKEIKPFMDMVKGFEQAFSQPVVRIFLDENKNPFSHDALYKGPGLKHYSCMVAVGPTALSYAVTLDDFNPEPDSSIYSGKVLYAMVFNPESFLKGGVDLCGISLNIFSSSQVSSIPAVFPDVQKIGVLFDPKNNAKWFARADKDAMSGRVELIPLYIRHQSDVNLLYQEGFEDVDALLFIPDRTVTSPTIIRHVIKQSLARGIPVIGYNRFFHTSGAALSFILDYKGIGTQMALMVRDFLERGLCTSRTPAFGMLLNPRVVDILRIKVAGDMLPDIEVLP